MRKNETTYSSLRAAEAKVESTFYANLSQKTLLLIYQIADGELGNPVSISSIKTRMSINLEALAKILDILLTQNNIEIKVVGGKKQEELSEDDLQIFLTNDGKAIAKSTIYSIQGLGL